MQPNEAQPDSAGAVHPFIIIRIHHDVITDVENIELTDDQ